MPALPDRPDLDQLRRQARELLRAASGRDPAAVARIRAVSDRTTLSAAQLALSREYGFRNWAALRAGVERRRSPLERWSFGGAAAIETLSGALLPEGLVAGADSAVLYTTLPRWDHDALPDREALTERPYGIDEEIGPQTPIDDHIRALGAATQTGDISVTDDQGSTYALRVLRRTGGHGPFPRSIWFRVDPVPGRGIEWIELVGQNGTAARLQPSPRAVVRLGRLTAVTASPSERELTRVARSAIALRLDAAGPQDHRLPQYPDTGLPRGWAAMLAAADRADGPRHHLDLGITLPPIDGMTLRLDSLISAPSRWSLPLRAQPRWPRYRDDQRRKWSPVEISAEDDRGCSYLYKFDGGSGRDGYEGLSLQFRPRLDPLARRLRLTCTGSTEQIAVDLDLSPGV